VGDIFVGSRRNEEFTNTTHQDWFQLDH